MAADYRVVLKTTQPEYAISCGTLLLSATSTNADISNLINHIRGESPVDFVIRLGCKRLVETLGTLVSEVELGGEDLIELYYELPTPQPEIVADIEEPDWIRVVAINQNRIITGSYDRRVRVYLTPIRGEPVLQHIINGFIDSPTALCIINEEVILVGCADGSLFACVCKPGASSFGAPVKVAIHPSAIQKIISTIDQVICADYDGHVFVYSLDSLVAAASQDREESESRSSNSGSTKKSRGGLPWFASRANRQTSSSTAILISATITWQAHNEPISFLGKVPSNGRVITASWDGVIKEWQLPEAIVINSWNTHESVTSATILHNGTQLVTGHSDGSIRVMSLVGSAGQLVASRRDAHAGWITSLSASEEGRLISCGHDGKVLLWDITDMTAPIKDYPVKGGKVLSSAWSAPLLAFGGEDKTLHVYRS